MIINSPLSPNKTARASWFPYPTSGSVPEDHILKPIQVKHQQTQDSKSQQWEVKLQRGFLSLRRDH